MKYYGRLLFNVAVGVGVIVALAYLVFVPIAQGLSMPDDIRLTRSELEDKQSISPNRFVTDMFANDAMVDDEAEAYIDLKLFGLIPIKRVKVDVLPFEKVLAGGVLVGFNTKTNGVVVLRDGQGYKRGDVITKLDGATITSVEDLEAHLDGKNMGVWVKDETSGVGMVTYINPENNNFAALGHKIVDHETGAAVNCRAGEAYMCNVIGIDKCNGKKIGEFKSTLKKGSEGVQGSVLSSNSRGLFGCLNSDSKLLELCQDNLYPVASRYTVKPGKAKILTSLDGQTVEEFDIEIIKTRYQKHNAGKGLILRVTDKRLLEKTGGIIHGMSGSPIIQNGKLVGAVTHVMVGDYTKGYGIYIDFVLP